MIVTPFTEERKRKARAWGGKAVSTRWDQRKANKHRKEEDVSTVAVDERHTQKKKNRKTKKNDNNTA